VAEVHHFQMGLLTPVLSYVMAVLGCGLGLAVAARARASTQPVRRAQFLVVAALAIGGTGIWLMHFIAMLGFDVPESQVRYDVPVTIGSALLAILVVGVGLFVAGYGETTGGRLLLGGLCMGLGVAVMHYTGMAAVHVNGSIDHVPALVAASVVIAVVAATVALWFTVVVNGKLAISAAALVMGVAVVGMHYTGMAGVQVHLRPQQGAISGEPATALLVPLFVLVCVVICGLLFAVLTGSADEEAADDKAVEPV